MKYVDEYRNKDLIESLILKIKSISSKNYSIMEICGGQTHTILKYSLQELLPKEINLIHGPGCPVCVTPIELIDKAISLSQRPDVIFTSYGDMLRVPGSSDDLLNCKARGAEVRMVYSPLDAVKIARENKEKKVVFFAVGFETTAPANARAIIEAEKLNLDNFSIISSHVLVPPAIEALLSSKNTNIDAFLAAGHVCTVMGYSQYENISEKYKIPIIVTGFEPVDILTGIYMAVKQLEDGRNIVENQYSRAVRRDGNLNAINLINSVFEISDRNWRGIGIITKSGLKMKEKYKRFDAEIIFDFPDLVVTQSNECIAGEILQGFKKPTDCPSFKNICNPEYPMGAPMVSPEGACSAYYLYKKRRN